MIYFSKTTKGFYDDSLQYMAMPSDVQPVSDQEYRALLNAQTRGDSIVADIRGCPISTDQKKPYPFSVWDGDKWISDTGKIRQYEREQAQRKLRKINQDLSEYVPFLFDVLIQRGVISLEDLPIVVRGLLKEREGIEGL
jgi:hypothetical protein